MTTAEQRRDIRSQFHEMTVPQLQELTDVGGRGAAAKVRTAGRHTQHAPSR